MIHRYANWTRRQGRTAQCSPALAVLGCIVAFAVVVYIYRQVIMTTIIDAVLAAVGIAIFTGAIAVTVSTIRWYRRKARADTWSRKAAQARADTWTGPSETTDADTAAISDEADWLASGVELAFSPDGKKLVAKDKK